MTSDWRKDAIAIIVAIEVAVLAESWRDWLKLWTFAVIALFVVFAIWGRLQKGQDG